MNSGAPPGKTIYFVIGEESGDRLGADLLESLKANNENINAIGLAGMRMQAQGMTSLFDVSEVAVAGLTAVIGALPKIIKRVNEVVADVVQKNPDCVVVIDSPDFSHAIAKRVRKRDPSIPIVNYVCPSVWAWREGRAKKMRAYIDHVLTLLPFEVDALKQLQGPPGTYVGHPLSATPAPSTDHKISKPPNLLLLPGSRRGEISRLMPVFEETLDLLVQRGSKFSAKIPTVEHLADEIRDQTSTWKVPVDIVEGEEAKQEAFKAADLALAASGTIVLELAVANIPTIVCYKLDPLMQRMESRIRVWTVSLPNLIADKHIVPEYLNNYCRSQSLARALEPLFTQSPERKLQLAGFATVREKMKVAKPSGELAAEIVLQLAR